MNIFFPLSRRNGRLSLWVSLLPVISLLVALLAIIIFLGADAIADFSPWALLGAGALACILAWSNRSWHPRALAGGLARSARQILPAVPMLICIAMVSTSWMLSGVVPTLIEYGLSWLNPIFFLVITCGVCAVVSVLTGSSWSTIATVGVAFMGIGSVMGYSAGWVAGAIISGAYFGDKISPLSDTTVVASSACGVDLFKHMKYLLLTSVPAMTVAMIVYMAVGVFVNSHTTVDSSRLLTALHTVFSTSPYTLVIPLVTLGMIILRVPTLITLALSALLGFGGIFIFQPQLAFTLTDGLMALWHGHTMTTGLDQLDSLVSTSGILGMIPTIQLVLSAMLFGAAMIGTGMLSRITRSITSRLRKRTSIVGATVASGLFMNSCTADQYLSLIITGNMYRNVYRRFRLEPRLLSRTIEDSVSVTSVLIPWNSCGITQSTVLGVATVVYFPFCVFNYLSPCMSLLLAWTGYKIPTPAPARLLPHPI